MRIGNKSIHLVRYTKTKINLTLQISKDEESFVRVLKEVLLSGKKIAIGCKQRALMWKRMFEIEYAGKMLTSDTAEKEIRQLRYLN